MEPLALALAAFGALGASALPSLLLVRRRSAALLERLGAVRNARAQAKGARVFGDAITSSGVIRVELRPGVLGNRWLLSAPLPGYRADERALLYPKLTPEAVGASAALDLGPPKRGLPRLPPSLSRAALSRALERASPELARGSYPVLAHGEAAWLMRLLLHPSADRALADEVLHAVEGFHITEKARRAGFERVLERLRGEAEPDEGTAEEAHSGLLLALEVRFHLALVAQAGWALSSCRIAESALHLVADDRGVTPLDELERRFTSLAALAGLLTRARDSDEEERFPCPSCRVVFLEPPAGELAERQCTRCRGRLLDGEALRRVVLDPLGKSPGELSQAARGAHGHGAVCPSCARPMAPVLLEGDVIVDLCVGCGSTWLDEGELARLSQGLYRG